MTISLSARAARLLSAAAALALATACPQPPPPDTTPPAAPTLSVPGLTDTSIQLTWTAVGDDGTDGTATTYELRSLSGSACPITRNNFATGTLVPGLGAPKAAGAAEAFNVTSLTGDTTYCFMLRVADEEGNFNFSAAVVGSTTDLVAPARATLIVSNTADTSVTIGWTAVGDNGVSGIASTYEMRSLSGASCPINAANFAGGAAVGSLPSPAAPGTNQSVTVSGLTPSADYCFALKISDEVGNSSLSVSVGATTSDTVAPAVVALQTGTATGTSIALSWTAVGDDGTTGTAASYELRSATGAGCPLTAANFSSGTAASGLPAPSAAGATEAFTVNGLTPDRAYCFMLKVTDDSGNSSLSNSASASTADLTAPNAAALSAGTVTGTSAQINWLAVGDDGSTGTAAFYELRSASGAACPLTQATFGSGTLVAGVPSPAAAGTPESMTATGLSSNTSYCFMLRVFDDAANTSYSNSLAVQTPDVTPPAATAILAGTVTGTSIQVQWVAVGDDGITGTATSYEMRYRSGASCPINAGNFGSSTQVSGLGAPAAPTTPESFTITGLTSDTGYCIMLKTNDEAGNSSFSNSLIQSTQDVTGPASAVLNGAAFDTSVQLNWTAVGDDGTTGTATSQELRYRSGASCPINAGNFGSSTQVSGLGAPAAAGTAESFTVNGLTRQTAYCFALRVADEAGNPSFSNSLSTTTTDTTAPAAAVLATANPGVSSIHVTWTAVGDDGTSGTAASYDLRYLSGAACPVTAANFASATAVTTGAPQAAGSAEDVTASGLTQGTSYCFALRVTDDASNVSALSNSASGSTLADTTAPGPVADLATGTTGATFIQLSWTAVADDGTTASTGPAASYEMRYLSGAACPITAGNFGTGSSVSGLPSPGAPGAPESVFATGLSTGASFCFLLKVSDAVGNSSFSNAATGTTIDNSPPATVTDLTALGPDTAGTVQLNWTAVGAHGASGTTATSYDLRYQTGNCSGFNFSTAIPVAGLPPPGPMGAPESFNVTGLSIFQQYCFGLQVTNETATSSLSNPFGFAFAGTSAQIAAIRQLIHDASSSPVTLNAAVQGAIVTYKKDTVNGRPPGIQDGPGFFIQNADTGPALFFAVDPDTFLPGMAVSDKLDISITQGVWAGCQTPPCGADDSLYMITQAAAVPVSTGSILPAVQDLTNTALPLPIGPGPWNLEHELVQATGTIGPVSAAGLGFERATLTTPGTNSTFQEFRFTDAVGVAKGIVAGCTVTINGTPMWRFGPFAQFSAWAPADVTPSGCPAPTVLFASPDNGTTGVSPTPDVTAFFDQPMTQASMNGQTVVGLCTGTIQLSGDNFATCVPFTTGSATLAGNNTQATLTSATTLKGASPYRIRITTAATSGNGSTLASAFTQATGFTVAGGTCTSVAPVVISQFYGGGGNSGATFTHDFVELHNRGTTPVNLTGWSLQYNSAAGTAAWGTNVLSNTIAPGGYFLVQLASQASVGAPLPTPDLVITAPPSIINMSATTGRIALMATTTPIPANTACPPAGSVVDFIGYGTTAPACFEGSAMPNLNNTSSGIRKNPAAPDIGCVDTNVNGTDLTVLTPPVPRNSVNTPANGCSCP
ncbi:MAG TPA: lamin tail domain-containing protein [Myxococcaceae bacterium]